MLSHQTTIWGAEGPAKELARTFVTTKAQDILIENRLTITEPSHYTRDSTHLFRHDGLIDTNFISS